MATLILPSRARERWRQSIGHAPLAVLESLPGHIAVLDAKGFVVSTNAAWRRFADEQHMNGSDYWLGRNYLEVCDTATGDGDAVAQEAAAGIRSVLSGHTQIYSLEYPCPTPTEDLWFLLTVTPVQAGGLKGAVAMHLDITARKHDEDEAHRVVAAMDASPEGIFLIDRARMCFVHINEAGCLMHGLEREQALAMPPWSVFEDSREKLESVYDAIIEGPGYSGPKEVFWERKSASPMWIEVRSHARRIGGRWIMVVLVRDVTLRREADLRIAYLNRVYALLSGINTLIVRVRDRQELFREACRIAVDEGALAMAWIGMLDPDCERIVPVDCAGMPEDFYAAIGSGLNENSVSIPGVSLLYQAIATRTALVSNAPQRDLRVPFSEMHIKHGVRSVAVFPLIIADEAVGVFVLYARERGFFHESVYV